MCSSNSGEIHLSAVSVAALVQRRAGTDPLRDWTRARSASSEGPKAEIYSYLAGGSRYTSGDRDSTLATQCRSLTATVADLERHTLHATADDKAPPPVSDVDSYVVHRVDHQIDCCYRPKATRCERRVGRLRASADGLGVIAVTLGAVAAALDITETRPPGSPSSPRPALR